MKELKHKIDPPRVTSDEALELMTHHLALAAAYYEATGGDENANFEEMKRLMDEKIQGYQGPCMVAAIAWFQTIRAYYDNLKDKIPLDESD